MSEEATEQKIPKGSYAAGRRVTIPEGAEQPIVVFINGVAQSEDQDYVLRGNEILFTREIIKEEKSGKKKLVMLLGVVGFYNKDETIDVQYQLNGKTELAGDLSVSK
ncbi:MAG TPA: hypothetical protein PKA56_05005 [Solirubrobacterales bacterium]|nr:hypothetical protein [Solirubrobacterales bacterium]HMX71093.1 hypothetical protein [Solirubrobacterales bacterium]HMY25255.1 hypothetical protein [Solirubrobacterales bacterium]HNA23992.1 hypothetical protein [Solirubrobacterales bacterium]HNA44263.1 hypothetical protein [Solirubrobacterales bacterium]